MHVEVGIVNLLVRAGERRLVNAGAVGEAALEQVVVPARHLLDRLGELQPLGGRQVDQGADVALGDDEHLEGPDGPPGAEHHERVVLPDHPLLLLQLQLDVVSQEVSPTVLAPVLGHLGKLLPRLLGHRGRRPDLAVGVRIRASHGGALVLEDLHVSVLVPRDGCVVAREGQLELLDAGVEGVGGGDVVGVDARPVLDDGENLGAGHVGKGEVVLGGEGEDVADALYTFSPEEKRFNWETSVSQEVIDVGCGLYALSPEDSVLSYSGCCSLTAL